MDPPTLFWSRLALGPNRQDSTGPRFGVERSQDRTAHGEAAMKSKPKFIPGQVIPMEERALLSNFPAALGPVTTLGLRGAFVLTSRTYEQVQNTVNKAILAFEQDVGRAFLRNGGATGAFFNVVGTNFTGFGPYAPRTLLGRVDSIMQRVEARLPFGQGLAGSTGGAGLSVRTAPTSTNPASVALGNLAVAELLDRVILNASGAANPIQAARTGMETVRADTLNIVGNAPVVTQVPGLLPDYVVAFGPGGAGLFGLRNSRS